MADSRGGHEVVPDQDWIAAYSKAVAGYEQLCTEVSYILERTLKIRRIAIAHTSHRVKALDSILEKTQRKLRVQTLADITDLAGVRIVHLYRADAPLIEQAVNEEFTVQQRQDKRQELGAQTFGYGGLHYLVTLSQSSSGARYDDLRDLVCEIQIRTVAQDAWAIMSHQLIYKHEAEVPETLVRQLSALAAMFEMADDQFDALRQSRLQYLEQLSVSASRGQLSIEQLNLDSLVLFLSNYFAVDLEVVDRQQVSVILRSIASMPYTTISSIQGVLRETERRREDYFASSSGVASPAAQLAVGMAIVEPLCRDPTWAWGWDDAALERLEGLSEAPEQ